MGASRAVLSRPEIVGRGAGTQPYCLATRSEITPVNGLRTPGVFPFTRNPFAVHSPRMSDDAQAAAPTEAPPTGDTGRFVRRLVLACLPALAGIAVFRLTELTPATLLASLGAIPAWATFVIIALAPLAGFPLAPLYAYAGLRHGPVAGYALAFAGVAANLALAHPLYGALLRGPVLARLDRHGWNPEKWRRSDRLRMTILVASVPALPFWAQNAVLAAAGTPFLLYFGVSLAVQSLFALGGVALGALGRDAAASTPVFVALLAALPLSVILIRRIKKPRTVAEA